MPNSPILALPADLLHAIFALLSAAYPFDAWFSGTNLVCKVWREIALGTAIMWREPLTHHPEICTLMLERSKEVDLIILMDDRTSIETAAAIMRHIAHIQSLTIAQPISTFKFTLALLQNVISAAMRLQDITIQFLGRPPGSTASISPMSFCAAPQLSQITLFSVDFGWKILPLWRITHLSMLECKTTAKIPIHLFLKKLEQMPLLEDIAFDSDILAPESFINSVGVISLPNLMSMDIGRITSEHLSAILSQTIIPRLHLLRVCLSYNNLADASFIPSVSHTILSGAFRGCNTLFIRSQSLQLSRMNRGKLDSAVGLHIFLFGVVPHGFIIRDVVAQLGDDILLRIRKLILDDLPLGQQLCHLLVIALSHIESIVVHSTQVPALARVLSPTVSTSSLNVPFPHLVNITLRGKELEQSHEKALIDCLTKRKNEKMLIQTVTIGKKSLAPGSDTLACLDCLGVDLVRTRII